MKRKNLKPKEKFRFRMQRFLSRRPVVVLICAVMGLFWLLLMNFGLQAILELFLAVKQRQFQNFTIPSPLRVEPSLWIVYLIAVALILIVCVKFGFRMVYAFEPLADSDAKGGQRWTVDQELKEQYRSVPEKDVTIHGRGGVPISRLGRRIFIDDGAVNNLILGMTRSGKGEVFMLPTIDIFSRARNIKDRPSLIHADPKGELAATTIPTLRARGYDCYVFNLKPPMDGLSYNPLELVKEAYISYLEKKARAQQLPNGDEKRKLIRDADMESANAETYARALAYIVNYDPNAKEKIWQDWGTAITTAAILAVVCDCCEAAQKSLQTGDKEGAQRWYEKITMYSVSRFIVDYCKPDPSDPTAPPPLDKYIMSKKWSARYQYSPVNAAEQRTKGNITAEALAKLTQLLLTPVAKLTAKNDLQFENIGFGDRPVALFLVTPDSDHSNDFILSMFITQLYQALCRRADRAPGSRCAREVRFELDEFGNIPPLPHMDSMITVCLGRNIRFDLIIQSYEQLESQYGKPAAETIIDNCANRYYLKSGSPDTNKKFSSLIGNQTIAVTSRFGTPLSIDKNMQESTDTKPLLNENDLPKLGIGETVIVRFMHTADLKGRPVNPYPIFNYGRTRLKPRFQYLLGTFPANHSFLDLDLSSGCTHLDVNLEEIVYDPIRQGMALSEQAPEPSVPEPRETPYKGHVEDPLFARLSEQTKTYLVTTLHDLDVFTEKQCDCLSSMTATEFETALHEALNVGRVDQDTYDKIMEEISPVVPPQNELVAQAVASEKGEAF